MNDFSGAGWRGREGEWFGVGQNSGLLGAGDGWIGVLPIEGVEMIGRIGDDGTDGRMLSRALHGRWWESETGLVGRFPLLVLS